VRCGHVEQFGLLPDGKDRFREDRRKKAMGRDCKACRERRYREEQEAAQLRRAQKQERKTQQAVRQARGEKAADTRPRLRRVPRGGGLYQARESPPPRARQGPASGV